MTTAYTALALRRAVRMTAAAMVVVIVEYLRPLCVRVPLAGPPCWSARRISPETASRRAQPTSGDNFTTKMHPSANQQFNNTHLPTTAWENYLFCLTNEPAHLKTILCYTDARKAASLYSVRITRRSVTRIRQF